MFNEKDIFKSKIDEGLEEKISKDPFEEEVLVIYNYLKRFGDKNDQLMKINFRRYGVTQEGSTKKRWHYTGDLCIMKKVNSAGVPIVPYESQVIYDVPEGNLITRRELLSF